MVFRRFRKATATRNTVETDSEPRVRGFGLRWPSNHAHRQNKTAPEVPKRRQTICSGSSLRDTTQTKRPSECKRRVSFESGPPESFPILGRRDYTLKEARSYWCQAHELNQIMSHCMQIVSISDRAESMGFCTRGLEHYINYQRTGGEEDRELRHDAFASVLIWGKSWSSEKVARVYRIASEPCQRVALELGKRDEMIAREIQAENA